MNDAISIAWALFAVYLVGTFWLAWLGHKKTKSFADFAVGKRDMGPAVAWALVGGSWEMSNPSI